MNKELFAEISFRHLNHHWERICGDSFMHKSFRMGRRTIAVLSDGMCHGVRANILSTYTATMLLNFIGSNRDITPTASMILNMLPVNPVNNVSYATFTIADIDNTTGDVVLIQHDNPSSIIIRGGNPVVLDWNEEIIERP